MRRNSFNIARTIEELARETIYGCDSWLRGSDNGREIELLNRATKRVQEESYLKTRIPAGFGLMDYPGFRFPELLYDVFDVWRNGSDQERVKIFGSKVAELERHVECATLAPNGEFRIWDELPSNICRRAYKNWNKQTHVSQGSKKMLFDAPIEKASSALSTFLEVFEDFGRCRTYHWGVVVFSPREYTCKFDSPQKSYVLERVDT